MAMRAQSLDRALPAIAGFIADRTGITERTVNFHMNNALGKLNVDNRTAAAVRAVVLGVVA